MKKFTSVFLAMVLTATVPAGFQTVYAEDTSAEDTQETKTDADNEADADQLLKDLTGSYQELWPVILADDYTQTWIDDCKEFVGEDDVEAAYEKLKSMVTGEVYGEEAVKAYENGGGAYFCGFIQDMATVEFDGDTKTIKGYDKDEKELFSLLPSCFFQESGSRNLEREIWRQGSNLQRESRNAWKQYRILKPATRKKHI